MSIVRVGSTKKFADNWDKIFGGKKSAPAKAAAKKAGNKKKAGRKSGAKAKKK